jgi:flotillin
MSFLAIAVIVASAFTFGTVAFLASRYRRCPSNRILCVYGRVRGGAVKAMHGGGTFVWPLIQECRFLDLTPMTINIPLRGALSMQNIRINVPSTFTVAINTTKESMYSAAVRLLELSGNQIENMAQEIIFGQLRLTVASLTIEEINQDRERFLSAIRANIEPELRKVGLGLLNVNITDITDESGYIDSIGKKAASTAINQAKVDVAEQDKAGSIGEADALQEQRVQVASFDASAVEGENTAQAKVAAYNADLAEAEAEAERRGEVARQYADASIQQARAATERARLAADEVVPREIAKEKVEIDAEAEAESVRRRARGEADAILAVKTAEAEGIQMVLDAKAEGYRRMVDAAGGDAREAASLLMVEKMEELVKLQTEAIRNLRIDKVTVWDGGGSRGTGSSTANFASSLIKSLPPLHEIARMAGLELPEFLGQVVEHGNGVSDRNITSLPATLSSSGDDSDGSGSTASRSASTRASSSNHRRSSSSPSHAEASGSSSRGDDGDSTGAHSETPVIHSTPPEGSEA